ncbi:hypothetical protein SDC9_154357 [bioreactor metagenome]|uniref:Uncharacterized protein n=1 Tax=bioreactor metagenome TaxID=1076179 RepID=A0A645EYJ1_9ZZZZ
MFSAANGRADGVGQNALNVRTAFLQIAHDPAEGAPAARACNEVVDVSV